MYHVNTNYSNAHRGHSEVGRVNNCSHFYTMLSEGIFAGARVARR